MVVKLYLENVASSNNIEWKCGKFIVKLMINTREILIIMFQKSFIINHNACDIKYIENF